MSAQPAAAPVRCGACGPTSGAVVVTCRGCGKQICDECLLEVEELSGMCWMCLDWTPEGGVWKERVKSLRRSRAASAAGGGIAS